MDDYCIDLDVILAGIKYLIHETGCNRFSFTVREANMICLALVLVCLTFESRKNSECVDVIPRVFASAVSAYVPVVCFWLFNKKKTRNSL